MSNFEQRDFDQREGGKTQLFVAKGKNHGMDAESLVEFVSSETGITNISNPKVLDDFSFIAVSAEDAEKILDHFQGKAGEGRSLVAKAKRKKPNDNNRFAGGRDREGGFSRDRRDGGDRREGGYRSERRDFGGRRNDRNSNSDNFGNF